MTTETKTQKQGLLGRFKNAVWTDDAKPADVQSVVPAELPVQTTDSTPADDAARRQRLADATIVKVDELTNLINADPEAAILQKFMSTLANLESVIQDETTRYKAAMAASGCTKEELLMQAAFYSNVFNTTNQTFIDTVITPAKETVTTLMAQSELTKAKISQLENELDAAKNELDALMAQANETDSAVRDATVVLSAAQKNVQASRETLAKKIEVFLG